MVFSDFLFKHMRAKKEKERKKERRKKKTRKKENEHVVIVKRIPASIILRLVVSIFSSSHIFLCFLGSHSSAAREKKKNREKIKNNREAPMASLRITQKS